MVPRLRVGSEPLHHLLAHTGRRAHRAVYVIVQLRVDWLPDMNDRLDALLNNNLVVCQRVVSSICREILRLQPRMDLPGFLDDTRQLRRVIPVRWQ